MTNDPIQNHPDNQWPVASHEAIMAALRLALGTHGNPTATISSEVARAIVAALEASQPMLSGGDGMVMVDWKSAYEEEAAKFQRETLRTSELTQALQKLIAIHREEHRKGPWSRGCWRCDAVSEAEALLEKPINSPAPASNGEDAFDIISAKLAASEAPSIDEAMVERVARAIAASTGDPCWHEPEEFSHSMQGASRCVARAAITAMNDPTRKHFR